MSVTLHHLNGPHRRRWLYHTFHTIGPLYFEREQLVVSNRRDSTEAFPNRGMKRKITGPSVVENSKIRQHLDHIESTKHNLALEDVERYKPNKILDFRQTTYDQKYKEIQNALIQSFTKPQLRIFLKLYGLPSLPSSKGKNTFAEILMKQWGMEPLAKVQEERADWRESSERLYPMSPAYAFLFMGKDGADLLNLAKRYNVHLSFVPDPLSLRVQGLKGAVKQLNGYVKNFEEDISLETARIPHGLTISDRITQSISRFSGAHVESSDDGKLLITHRKSDPASANRAKRLAVQAASKQLDVFESSVYALDKFTNVDTKSIEESEPPHSFYPFFSSQIPLSKFLASSAFRLRQVGRWLRAGARYNMVGEDASSLSLNKESVSWIKARLLDDLSARQLSNSKMEVTATPGHILFLVPSEQTNFQPPIPGDLNQDVVLNWAKENPSQVVFNPSVPKSLVTSWPHTQNQFHRIVYKALPTTSKITRGDSLRKTLVLEILPGPVSDGSDSTDSNTPKPSQTICCEHRIETHADILLPSRATDIRISVSLVEAIASSKVLKVLRSFTELDLLTQPIDPPLTLTLDGVPYVLSSTSQIRREHRHSSKSPKEIEYDFVTETTVDPEDGQELMVCKVPCTKPSSDWNEFFTRCDHISTVDSKPSDHPLSMMKPWFEDSSPNANESTQAENGGTSQGYL